MRVSISAAMPIVFASVLCAQDLKTPGEQVLDELARALSADDRKQAVLLLDELGALYRFPASAAEAAALLKAAGDAAKSNDPVIAAAALRALGDTRAPAAVALIKPFLRGRTETPRKTIAAIRAAGRLGAGEFVAPLAEIAKSSANMTLADQAFLALGDYHAAKTDLRKRVTDKTLSICATTSRSRKRWRRLRAPGLRALQRLMDRRLNSVQQFSDYWKFARTRRDPFKNPG